MENLTIISRKKTEAELKSFISNGNRSELVYFRGRRRVGKTTLLKQLTALNESVFYFLGVADESNRESLVRFAKAWDEFEGQVFLSRLKQAEIDWPTCFDQITKAAQNNLKKNLTIIFDEIQWIAKARSGFVGILKDKWIDWERTGNIKVIICGSSNKFFIEQTGGEEKILRGLKTRADIVLQPLTTDEVRKHYFPRWNIDELVMIQMMLGGVPYYLNQISKNQGFIRAANEALFTKKTIFLSEVDEILNLEFNRAGTITVKRILATLGPWGGTFAQLALSLNVSRGGLFEIVQKLLDYSILKEKMVFGNKRAPEKVYFFDDPYLLFYFSCLEKMRIQIEDNDSQLLIANLIGSDRALYIANFSGRAFELYIRRLLLMPSSDYQFSFLSQLGVLDRDFELYDIFSESNAGDFLLVHRKLRTHFVIECKWSHNSELIKEGITQLARYKPDDLNIRTERVLVTNYKPSVRMINSAQAENVKVICTADWIEGAR